MNKLINFKKYKIIRLEFLLILQQFWPQNFPQVPAEKRQYLQAMHNDLFEQWPNLKNLSGGLNLSRGLNMVGST